MKWWRLVIAILLVAAVSVSGELPARADTTLIGWTAQADANPFDVVIDNASGLGGAHPLVEADLPDDSSDFETGPFGHGLASVFWPGATLGNAGSLAGELGLPAQFAPLIDKLNDPVRAETFYPEGPASATFPSKSLGDVAEMSSHADGNGTSAKAGLTDVSVPLLFDIKGVHGNTTATAGAQAIATATGTFASISLLGGLVQIGSSTSTVSASSDGVSPSGSGSTHIGAITIAGQPVTVGSEGLVVGPAKSNLLGVLLAPVTSLINQLISVLNLKITLLPQDETTQAPAEEINSGGLQVSFALPSTGKLSLNCNFLPAALAQLGILCHLPDELEGLKVTATIARVTATAIATPPFGNPTPSGGTPPASSPSTSPPGTTPATVAVSYPTGPSIATPAGGTVVPTTAGSPTVATTPPRSSSSPTAGILPISLTSPVKAGLLGTLLVLAVLVGIGLSRMGRVLEEPPPTSCSLEEQP